MTRKIIRLAAKKLQQDNQASHQCLVDCFDNLEHRGLLGQPAVTFLPPTVWFSDQQNCKFSRSRWKSCEHSFQLSLKKILWQNQIWMISDSEMAIGSEPAVLGSETALLGLLFSRLGIHNDRFGIWNDRFRTQNRRFAIRKSFQSPNQPFQTLNGYEN